MEFEKLSNGKLIAAIVYLVVLSFFTVSFIKSSTDLGFCSIIFVIMAVIGTIFIYYSDRKSYKVAFIVILVFGLCSAFITPINDVSDEYEHLTRAQIVSTGEVVAPYNHGFKSMEAINELGSASNENLFENHMWNEKINYSEYISSCAFAQNPFYAYLAPAFGILVAEMLNLSTLWMFFLARFMNVILYAVVVSFAIKKAPKFKFPLFLVAVFPLAIYQAGSVSSDCFSYAFSILAIAYFIRLYKCEEIRYRDLGVFYISIILAGLLKEPYLALTLLIFAVPNANFKDKKQNIIAKSGILISLLIGGVWSHYATGELNYSWRANHFLKYHVNASEQAKFMLSNTSFDAFYVCKVFTDIPTVLAKMFDFSVSEFGYTSKILATAYAIFLVAVSLFYPLKEKLEKIERVKVAIVGGIIYYGIFIVQYLTWIPVKAHNVIQGVAGRYFVPLLAFIPLIFNISHKIEFNKELFRTIAFALAISFTAAMIMLTTCVKF